MRIRKEFIDKLTLIVFLIIVGTPLIVLALDRFVGTDGETDKAAFPLSINAMPLDKVPMAIEKWFDQSFGFRQQFILLNSYCKYMLLNVAPRSEKVVVGKNGWLFLGNSHDKIIDQHLGRCPASDDDLERIARNEKIRRDWLRRRGISYLSVVAPDKHSIYDEYLPSWRRLTHDRSNTAKITATIKNAGVRNLTLNDAIASKKKEYGPYLYRKTDTHWSALGAYFAYEEVVAALAEIVGPLKRYSMTSWRIVPAGAGGDLAGMMGLGAHLPDHVAVLDYQPAFAGLRVRQFSGDVKGYAPTNSPSDFQDAMVTNHKALNDLSILCLRDSFFAQLATLFSQTFSRVAYTHYGREYAGMIDQLLLDVKPDVVLFERVERVLLWNALKLYPIMDQPELTSLECARIWPYIDADEFFFCPERRPTAQNTSAIASLERVSGRVRVVVDTGAISPKNIIVKLDLSTSAAGRMEYRLHPPTTPEAAAVAAKGVPCKPGRQTLYFEVIGQDGARELRIEPSEGMGEIIVHELGLKAFNEKDLPRFYRRVPPRF